MEKLIWFIIVFSVIYLFYFLFIICRKKKLEKFKTSVEVQFLIKKFKLNIDKINIKLLAHLIAMANALIISTTFTIVEFFDNVIIKLMMAFVSLMFLILVIYSILGKTLKKKEGK